MSERARTTSPRAELVGLLHAARQEPQDDLARLVVADWLEEHGDGTDLARAEFIRLQVRFGLPPKTGGRPQALLAEHRAVWLGPFAKLGEEVSFENGMIALNVSASELVGREGARLARGEAMCWLEKVRLQPAGDADVVLLLPSPLLPQIGNLVISSADLGIESEIVLLSGTATSGLVALDVGNNCLSNLGASALAASPALGGLRSLALQGNRIGILGAEAFARTNSMHELRYLNLGGNNIKDKGMEAVVASRLIAKVESLFLSGNDIRGMGVARLAQSPMAENLRRFELSENAIDDEGASAIARSPHLKSLERLNLARNRITDVGAWALVQSCHLSRLTEIDLAGNLLSDAMMKAVNERFSDREPEA